LNQTAAWLVAAIERPKWQQEQDEVDVAL